MRLVDNGKILSTWVERALDTWMYVLYSRFYVWDLNFCEIRESTQHQTKLFFYHSFDISLDTRQIVTWQTVLLKLHDFSCLQNFWTCDIPAVWYCTASIFERNIFKISFKLFTVKFIKEINAYKIYNTVIVAKQQPRCKHYI